MKRIRVMVMTLVLSVAMLVPEFSMLPAAYAQNETAALTQPAVSLEGSETAADADEEAFAEEPEVTEGTNEAGVKTPEGAAEAASAGEQSPRPAAGDDAAAAEQVTGEVAGAEDAAEVQTSFGAYDKQILTGLDEGGSLVIPADMQEAVTKEHSQYGNCVLINGKVADLNKVKISIGELDFNEGSVGRLTFDGLKDKDRGMTVKVLVYLDNEEEPTSEFALRKQMGKKEWSNDGELTVSLGSRKISGKHTVSLGFKVEGKKDTSKTTVALRSMQFCKTTVPVMYFNIDEAEGTVADMNASEDHSVECYGSVDLVVPDEFNADTTFRDEYGTQESQYGLELEYIRGRGNSTWMDDKKPYKVKFDKAQDLFGFGKNKHWVLLANRYDNSFVRNRMTYWLGQQLGLEYTPQCVPVEVVMNGEFYGSYLLCEQIRVGKGRVTIDDLDDIKDVPAVTDELIKTGGYLLSMDYEEDPDRLFETENGMRIYIESPDENVKYFSEYIKAYTQKMENALYGEGFRDADGHPYTDYLDMDSAVDYWWVQEFSANGDAYGSGSTYLYKKRDSADEPGKLYWGPLWDFDYVAWGDLEYGNEAPDTLDYTSTPWFEMMKSDPAFIEKVKTRWSEKGGIKDQMNEITKEGGRLDKYLAQMETSYIYDHDKWGAYDSKIKEYKGEIEQLRTWIIQRTEYVDKEVQELKVEDHNVKFVIDGKVVKEFTAKGYLHERDFPEVPEKKGYVFEAWVNEADEGYYDAGARVTEDLVLNAQYIKESDVAKPEKIFFKNYDVYLSSEMFDGYEGNTAWYFPEAKVMPEDADGTLTWTSSDENIAEIDEDGVIVCKALGDVTITATASNGISNSFMIHIVDSSFEDYNEDLQFDRTSMTLKVGGYDQIRVSPVEKSILDPEVVWVSTNENVATVDEIGIVTGRSAGKADILGVNLMTRETMKCSVTVKSADNKGAIVKRGGSTYKITSDKKGSRKAMLIRAKNAAKVTVPAYIKYDGKKYRITKIKAGAFAKSKATRLVIKTKKLSKARVKKALRGSKVKKIYVRVGKKSVNKKYIKKYKKIFTKKNAGKGVVVSNA